ncbi:hypothetical protein Tco_1210864 [Tanacetum coccineum]
MVKGGELGRGCHAPSESGEAACRICGRHCVACRDKPSACDGLADWGAREGGGRHAPDVGGTGEDGRSGREGGRRTLQEVRCRLVGFSVVVSRGRELGWGKGSVKRCRRKVVQ